MRRSLLLLMLLLIVRPAAAFNADVSGQDPAAVVRELVAAVTDGSVDRLSSWFTPNGLTGIQALQAKERSDGRLRRLGQVSTTDLTDRDETPTGTAVDVTVTHADGFSFWTLKFDDAAARIDLVTVEMQPAPQAAAAEEAAAAQEAAVQEAARRAAAQEAVARAAAQEAVARAAQEAVARAVAHAAPSRPHRYGYHSRRPPPSPSAPADLPPSSPAPEIPSLPGPRPSPLGGEDQAVDARTVDFLFATTRKTLGGGDAITFTADRSDGVQYGTVRVHVPDQNAHQPGRVELPRRISFFGVTLYEAKLDEKKHFVIRYAKLLSDKDFFDTLAGGSDKEALVFVHGFNNSFEASTYRFAQILFDLQYKKPAILFSWASKGEIADYGYDKESALIARDNFRALLRNLRAKGITKVNVIAHSMGNLVVIDALANAAETADPARVAQLIMAAPDVDRDYFRQMEPKLARIADGLTLYACATDRALMLSKEVAGGIPRAGDVPAEGPITMPGLDTIDVSALGQDWFGINHDLFASNRSVLQDIVSLLALGKPPPRLDMVHGMPIGTTPPAFWRFQP